MVGRGPWLLMLETFLVQQLLRSPAFHRAVGRVAKGVHRVRYGVPPDEMGGTKIDQPEQSKFIRHFYDEVRTQLGAAEQDQAAVGAKGRVTKKEPAAPQEENSDTAWQNAQKNISQPPRQGFIGEYASALREQMKGRNGAK